MKIWTGYGSEHSMNLVMIGYFKDARDADGAKQLIDRITEQVGEEAGAYRSDASPHERSFSKAMLALLTSSQLYSIAFVDLEQFGYDARVTLDDKKVVVTTDEVDVSAFLKVLIDKGARVEVYSAHDYPGTGYGRSG